ncbi:hypothetical protein M441DRAFT_396214 [Trichoderma asperellum CBS 433.97]|uniref:Uncharacterized protein n=1 Tax=Trichoderma asperellum (strain ATCC 204424 / CBS 433.97 / NBRC 101777) TaxID=1042311 RepID=A0A2T3Z8Z2_TRIA4|nr:hypothetical protein M441DRAFT_396214 [Trichoderma asperellum CBS 433.97]PTB41278.1 hypothetical protein M441DRAFT_396214 [Trichoderma asperellum CBS 433.97]
MPTAIGRYETAVDVDAQNSLNPSCVLNSLPCSSKYKKTKQNTKRYSVCWYPTNMYKNHNPTMIDAAPHSR